MIGVEIIGAAANLRGAGQSLVLPATPPEMLDKIFALEQFSLERCEQVDIPTEHLLHAGMYVRTIRMPADVVLTGALMKRATVVIVCGQVRMCAGSEYIELEGYNVIPAAAGRKQVFLSRSQVVITMMFPTDAKSVEEAEAEFTDQASELLSRRQNLNRMGDTGSRLKGDDDGE